MHYCVQSCTAVSLVACFATLDSRYECGLCYTDISIGLLMHYCVQFSTAVSLVACFATLDSRYECGLCYTDIGIGPLMHYCVQSSTAVSLCAIKTCICSSTLLYNIDMRCEKLSCCGT